MGPSRIIRFGGISMSPAQQAGSDSTTAADAPKTTAADESPERKTPLQTPPQAAPPAAGEHGGGHANGRTMTLALAALGVVYGDIGTSPLYAVKECFHGQHAVPLLPVNIMGVLSLIVWSLIIVVSLKYVMFVMRADNKGEGGIFALLALIKSSVENGQEAPCAAHLLGAVRRGAALWRRHHHPGHLRALGHGGHERGHRCGRALHPARHLPHPGGAVLGAKARHGAHRQGLRPADDHLVRGHAALGVQSIITRPEILAAVNPMYAYWFFAANHWHGLVVLGSVVLCITGGEALYADMGHFGRRPIRMSWYAIVLPALVLNYFGQGALLLDKPAMAFNPFFALVPEIMLYPMVALATVATVIASQAMISGVYSLTQQAVQLGYCPRIRIINTSAETKGQIYLPGVNNAMMFACIGLVLAFKSSSGLAGATASPSPPPWPSPR
jgi:K+ transporter